MSHLTYLDLGIIEAFELVKGLVEDHIPTRHPTVAYKGIGDSLILKSLQNRLRSL